VTAFRPKIINFLERDKVEALRQVVQTNRRFVITTHVNPDGDALGCELGLFHALRQLGKEVAILNHSAVPDMYAFMNREGYIQKFEPEQHTALLKQADVVILVDIGEWERLRTVGEALKELKRFTVCIDHHPPNGRAADLEIIHTQASSTGEIVFLLLQELGIKFDLPIATALYTAIMTDTGSFHFTNTTVNSHYMAGVLIELGVDYLGIYRQVYENEKLGKIRLLAELLSRLEFACDGRVAWYVVTREMLERYGLKPGDTEGLADFPRRIQGVEISVLFQELKDRLTKVSLRSTGNIPINGLAQKFGGGGHPYASGAVLEKPLDEVVEEFRRSIEEFYRKNKKLLPVG
jgi:phosphoesterase RecJ-like protein